MPIHPAQFSSRSRPAPRRRLLKLGRVPRLVIKVSLLIIFIFALVRVFQLGVAVASGLQNIPNQNNYPISIKVSDRTNLLLVRLTGSDPVELAVLSIGGGGKAKVLPLPVTLYTTLARGYGFYSLSGAWKLGNLEGKEGLNLLRDSVSRTLAIPIDGYLAVSESWWANFSAQYGSVSAVSAHLTSWQFILSLAEPSFPGTGVYGSISGWQGRNLAWMIRSGGGLEELNLSGTTITQSSEDGPLTVIESNTFDSKLGPHFYESGTLREHARVSIINSSGIVGAGSTLARYIKNLGGEVITVGSGEEVAKSEIRDHLGGSKLGVRLAPLIRANIVTDSKPGRADLEIVIGRDNKGWF